MTVEEILAPFWRQALEDGEQAWIAGLEKLAVLDGIAFAFDHLEPTSALSAQGLSRLVRTQLLPNSREPELSSLTDTEKLFVLTVELLANNIRRVVTDSLRSDDLLELPSKGIIQYFSDDLRFQVLARYSASGGLADVLVVENPVLFADPIAMIEVATTDRELSIVVDSMRSGHKIVLVGNVLVHVDRGATPGVFGPSIDTLVFTDWLLTNRFATQRTTSNERFFSDPIRREVTEELKRGGTRVLEIGSGSGLILAAFARNEARLAGFEAVDVSLDAIGATYRNSYRKRQLHGGWIGDVGRFTIGTFQPDSGMTAYDLVVCNPPYIPRSAAEALDDPHTAATMGTELLELVTNTCSQLAPDGETLMIMSNLSLGAFKSAMPRNMQYEELLRKEVPFRIESAGVDADPNVLAVLQKAGLRSRVRKGRTIYEHDVILFRLTRSLEETDAGS